MKNPLTMPFLLPPFSKISTEHMVSAVTESLINCREKINSIVTNGTPYFWENLCQPLLEVDNDLERIISTVSHLHSVKNNSELRKAYEEILSLLSEYNIWVSQHQGLYRAYCDIRNNNYSANLNTEQKKIIDNTIHDFRLSGVELSKKGKRRYEEIVVCLSKLSNQYSNNILDATMGWKKLVTNKKELVGIPEDVLSITKIQTEEKKQTGWFLTLDMPIYLSVMTYCNNQDIREEMYWAYNTRASDQGPNAGRWDNNAIMHEIMILRHELAKLLGFKNYVYKSLSTKMVKQPKQVFDFLISLVKRARPYGEQELSQLCNFAKKKYGVKKLHPWDIAWYSEKQKKYIYNISSEQLRSYFPENKVLNGLFELVRRIYNISIKERYDVDVWHQDVRFFEIYDNNKKLLGSFYLDLYVRANKNSGAWMCECMNQIRKSDGSLQKPVAYLVCNFNSPLINGEQALLTHDEVITLFHEFGHGLHHILSRIEIAGISGINGIPWDAIEFPSQFMENWCWESDVLKLISGHYKTEEPISEEMLKNVLAVKNYQSAMSILRQLEFGLFDFQLHAEFSPRKKKTILKVLEEIKKHVSVVPSASWERFPCTFSHIFSGDYAAGYYSYLWSSMLAMDAYSLFKIKGIFNREVGQSFLDNILARGGCEEPMELFKRFRGREPRIDAMLEYYNIC